MTKAARITDSEHSVNRAARLKDLAALFLKLGTTAFGGPAAHIAMMEVEVVRRKDWLSHDEFLDLIGVTHLIPVLLIAGACFILPAMLMVLALSWVHVRYGSMPVFDGILSTLKPVVLAVILQALWGLSRRAIKSLLLAGLGFCALAAHLAGAGELLILFMAGQRCSRCTRCDPAGEACFAPSHRFTCWRRPQRWTCRRSLRYSRQ